MTKTILVIVALLIVGILFIKGLMVLLTHAERLADEEHQERRKVTRDFRDAEADLEQEIDIMKRRSAREHKEAGK